MRKIVFCLLAGLLVAGIASADSLAVTGGAALEGSFGLEVTHDNTSTAYVQDNTPTDEGVYRASFLLDPNGISPETGNWRQTLFIAFSDTPGTGGCAGFPPSTSALRLFAYFTGGNGQDYNVQAWARGNQCGEANTLRIPIASSGASRICLEVETGASLSGRLAIAVVAPGDPCPTSGGAGWEERAISNNQLAVDTVRLGTPQTNSFGVGENGTIFFDSFESFRTLAP